MSVQDLLTQAEQIEKKAQWAQAADLYRSVLKNSSNNIVAREKLGWCLSRKGDYEEAIVVFQELIEIQPNIAKWPYMIGYQYYGQQRWREAIEWFSKSLDLNPKYIAVLYRKGYAHFKLGELGECLQSFETCRSLWHELPEGFKGSRGNKSKHLQRQSIVAVVLIFILFSALIFLPFADRQGVGVMIGNQAARWSGLVLVGLGLVLIFWSGVAL